jgi:hypothetical protein
MVFPKQFANLRDISSLSRNKPFVFGGHTRSESFQNIFEMFVIQRRILLDFFHVRYEIF